MKRVLLRFVVRWLVCSLGLWIAASLLGERISYDQKLGVILTSGLILALVNMIIKPIIVLFSLPAILFSLGLFMIVINGFMVWLVGRLYEPLHITGFGTALLAGIIIGFVNFLVTTILDNNDLFKKPKHRTA